MKIKIIREAVTLFEEEFIEGENGDAIIDKIDTYEKDDLDSVCYVFKKGVKVEDLADGVEEIDPDQIEEYNIILK